MNSSQGPFYKDQVMLKSRINQMKAQHNLPVKQQLSTFVGVPDPVLTSNEEHQKYVDQKIDLMFFKPERSTRVYRSNDFKQTIRKKARFIDRS